MKTLILVHPGSLCGSARAMLGKYDADAAREEILYQVSHHHGPLVVIDGSFSDELSRAENELIETSLARNEALGYLALRIWGCDAGDAPYIGWKPTGLMGKHAVFDGQEEAACSIADLIDTPIIEITGAWATEDRSSGCVCSVHDALVSVHGPARDIRVSDMALMEPGNYPEDSFTAD
ncbi:hypothetical protein [Pseudosulfitobacter pseudonitzschiae]|uniref:hypothetical protein n=1 Tax=Pseudosulfitobacter pseudonitzschiae TaxID=1402135 RepID=UPI003B80822C